MTTTFIPAHGLPTSVKAKFSGRSRSSFYYKRKRATKDQEEAAKLKMVHDVHPYYGHRRLALATKMNKKKVRRLMRRFSLSARTSRKRRAKNQYTQLKTSLPNRLKDIELTSPDQVWAGDFTHVTFRRKTYYFATVIDAYTREVIGWHVAGRIPSSWSWRPSAWPSRKEGRCQTCSILTTEANI
jgi:putative transposase